ncbi:uncharacterized protein LOC122364992 [Amphibalanus amphitrite]|uniref:uncharacterized protein LOC122364992 n=1 Tax=Amphibalanus amphitrite TaxID=1232801 RepID=UPI001C90EDFC|nr:uncharacterized protein LOC122364992 [Amphibalanus amphitrite]
MNLDVDSDLKKHTDLKAKTLQNISEAKKEIRLLTSELQNEQRSEEAKLTTKYRQLEREKATFSVYHRVSGNMRLDSQHTGPEVRGVVSSAPTTAITFSMRPDELSTAKLTDRLWQTAARDQGVSKAVVDVK